MRPAPGIDVRAFVVPLLVAGSLFSRRAGAQARPLRWDIGFETGIIQRFATGADSNAPAPTLGPAAELHGSIALVPMLRAGPYVAFDLSPVSGRPARQMTEAGLRLKLTPPLLSAPWRSWAFVGAGYVRTYAPGHSVAAPEAGAPPAERVGGAGGGILDVPFGLGLGLRVRGPWVLFAEVGGRVGLFFTGSMYERTQCLCADPYLGKDSFAAELSVGVGLDE